MMISNDLQYLLFPEGMRYDKENKRVRTPRVNSVVSLISSVARVSEGNEKGYLVKSSLDSRFVERYGNRTRLCPVKGGCPNR